VSILAYAGSRPNEALQLGWQDVRQRTLIIEPANSITRRYRRVKGGSKPAAPVLPRSGGGF